MLEFLWSGASKSGPRLTAEASTIPTGAAESAGEPATRMETEGTGATRPTDDAETSLRPVVPGGSGTPYHPQVGPAESTDSSTIEQDQVARGGPAELDPSATRSARPQHWTDEDEELI